MTYYRRVLSLSALIVWLAGTTLDGSQAWAQSRPLSGTEHQINFDRAPLTDFIKSMSERLGMAVLNDIDTVTSRGSVTIHKDDAVSRQDMLDLFIAGLRDNGAVLVKTGMVYQVVPLSQGTGEGMEPVTSASPIPPVSRSAHGYTSVRMSYNGARISDFCSSIVDMLEITPVVISPALKGSVTFFGFATLTHDEVFAVFQAVLKNNGAMLVWSLGRYRIVPISTNLEAGWSTITDLPPQSMGYGKRRQRRSVRPEELESHLISRVDPVINQAPGQPKLTGTVGVEIALNEQAELDILSVWMPARPALDEAAIEAVKLWRFRPFTGSDGLPERIRGTLTIVFK